MAHSIWPKIKPGFVSAMLAGHSVLGLAFAALIYLLCLSGTILVLAHEISRWENPNATRLAPSEVSIETLASALEAGVEQARIENTLDYVMVMAPTREVPVLVVRSLDFTTGHGEWQRAADATGALKEPLRDEFGHFLEHLHFYFHLPDLIGLSLVGLVGVTLLSSIFSGVLSHPRIFRDAFRFRRGGSKRLEEAELHNRLSVWGLPFHITVSLTGALLGLSTVILGLLAFAKFDGDMVAARAVVGGPQIEANADPAPLPPMSDIMTALIADHPDDRIERLVLRRPLTEGQAFEVYLSNGTDLTITERYIYNGAGDLVGQRGFADGPLGAQIVAALGPLHFGWFGEGAFALFVKLAYVGLGAALTVITTGGVAIWIARRQDKGQPVPGWARAWTSVVWGQPLAFTLLGLISLVLPHAPWVLIYLGLTAASFAPGFLAPSPLWASRILRGLTALALIACALVHLGLMKGYADRVSLTLDVALLALAGLLVSSIKLTRPVPAPDPAQ